MPDEALISQIENILAEVIELGGANERSQIVPNLTVQDANPAKTGFIIVSDDRDGDNIFAKKVGSVIYSNNDKVNVVFPRGGEAIAFQQGSQSSNSGIWEIVPSTSTDIFYDKGKVGIGTDEIPHGGVGWATLAIDGGDFAADGANIQLTTSADDYPTMQIFGGGTHDEVGIFFDSYYDGTNRSSTTDQNFQILATGGRLRFRYDSGVAAGAALSWNEGIALRTDGTVGIGTITPGAKLESVSSTGAQFRASHTTASKFLDITVDTNHDATFKPSSTGQIIFQPTTDQTNFLQVLDADGGNPVLNVDATNERVGFGTATPSTTVDAIRRDASGTVFRMENTAGVSTASFINSASKEWNFGVLGGASGAFAITEVGVASQFFVAAGGNVGIGTITPGAKLESVLSTGAQLRLSHTTASKFLDVTVDTNHDALFKTSSTGGFRFQPTTDQTDSFQILDADGGTPTFNVDLVNERIGIGTASPSYAIEVSGAASPSIVVTDTTNPCQTIMQSQDAEGFFGTITNHPWSVTTNGIRRLTIDTAGDVGIATTSPAARLEVEDSGTANPVLLKVTSDDGSPFGLVVGNDTFSATDTHGIRLWISDAGVGNIDVANASGQPLRINQAGGDVSIGHSGSPSTRLDIDAGAMEFAEMTAPGAGAVNTCRIYAEDNGAGKTRLMAIFNTGAAVQIAIEP